MVCLWGGVFRVRVRRSVVSPYGKRVYDGVQLNVSSGPKRRESEIMFSFFVSDMHSRKLQQRLNEKLWLVENYFRAHGSWRSNGPSHIPQCSQNPSKSIPHRTLRIKTTSTSFLFLQPPSPPHVTTMSCPLLPLEATWFTSVHAAPRALRLKLPAVVWRLGSAAVLLLFSPPLQRTPACSES